MVRAFSGIFLLAGICCATSLQAQSALRLGIIKPDRASVVRSVAKNRQVGAFVQAAPLPGQSPLSMNVYRPAKGHYAGFNRSGLWVYYKTLLYGYSPETGLMTSAIWHDTISGDTLFKDEYVYCRQAEMLGTDSIHRFYWWNAPGYFRCVRQEERLHSKGNYAGYKTYEHSTYGDSMVLSTNEVCRNWYDDRGRLIESLDYFDDPFPTAHNDTNYRMRRSYISPTCSEKFIKRADDIQMSYNYDSSRYDTVNWTWDVFEWDTVRGIITESRYYTWPDTITDFRLRLSYFQNDSAVYNREYFLRDSSRWVNIGRDMYFTQGRVFQRSHFSKAPPDSADRLTQRYTEIYDYNYPWAPRTHKVASYIEANFTMPIDSFYSNESIFQYMQNGDYATETYREYGTAIGNQSWQTHYTITYADYFELTITGAALCEPVKPVSAYPNPASSSMSVNGKPGEQVRLYSVDGVLKITTLLDGYGKARIDMSALPKGMYTLRTPGSVTRVIKG